MLAFQRADSIYRNFNNFNFSRRTIDGFSPITQIKKISAIIFRLLDEELDDSIDELKLAVWRLNSTIELSILSFDSPLLRLQELLEEVQLAGRFYPELQGHLGSLTELVGWLKSNPHNPKQLELIERIRSFGSDKKIGIASRLVRARIPGWDEDSWLEFMFSLEEYTPAISVATAECTRIISVATLNKDLFDLIIVPSGGRAIPFRRELFTSFAAPQLLMVCYDCEAKFKYFPRILPTGSMKFNSSPKLKSHELTEIVSTDATDIDDWFDKSFWDLARKNFLNGHENSNNSNSGRFTVSGRLALLGAKKGVYFPDGHKIIEISDLIEGRVDIDNFGNSFPKKSVQELKRGNLVVLRTSGSGDALDDVSASLMLNDGKFELLDSSCEWKKMLGKVLEQHGVDAVAAMLACAGHQVRDPHYLWTWTTLIVTRPESENTFIDLIKIIQTLGCKIPFDSPEVYAREKWGEMGELIRYRMKAGQRIRVSLLQILREFIKNGVEIEDEHHLSLAGVGGGELTIFRVTGIDSHSQQVPYSKTGVIADVEA